MNHSLKKSFIVFSCCFTLAGTATLATPASLTNVSQAAVEVPEYGVPFDVSYRYSPEEVHTMYKELNSNWNSTVQQIASLHPVVGVTLFLNNIGSAKVKETIAQAHFANKGMRLTYTYTLSPISPAANKMENMKLVVE